jgi:hypothetical protein
LAVWDFEKEASKRRCRRRWRGRRGEGRGRKGKEGGVDLEEALEEGRVLLNVLDDLDVVEEDELADGAEGDVVDVSRHYLPFECQRLGIMRR